MNLVLDAASEERAAMNFMLTDPDVLADYVNGFYGPNGPYPTETAEEAAQRQEHGSTCTVRARDHCSRAAWCSSELRASSNGYADPRSCSPPAARSFWGDFSSMMDNNPEQAWQFLAGAPQQAFQQKMLVQDY